MSIVAANVPEASSCKEGKVKTRVRSFHRKHHASKVKNHGVTAVMSDGQSSRAWPSTRARRPLKGQNRFRMEINRSLADGSEPAEIVDISNLDLRQLRTLLEEHELSSRDALDKALLKKQSAELYYELTRTREAQAQSYLRRYEDAEVVVQELRKAIVDRSKLVLERQFVTSPTPAREKRQHVSLQTRMI